jgi:DNA-binding response OmpR family regulator
VRDFVIECLETDYRVLAADNGKTGLEMARRELPDLIISDVMMPELDGVEMARRLASDPTTRALPVILLTARTATDDELEGLESGAVDYLTKPFSPEILNARIRRMLGFARRLREQVRIERADRARIAETSQDETDLTTLLQQQVLTRLDDERLEVQTLAEALHMSRSRLKRAMSEAGLPPPATYIRNLRLREAASLLERRRGNISEVAYAVGFASVSHFSRRFREHFGVAPSEYIKR